TPPYYSLLSSYLNPTARVCSSMYFPVYAALLDLHSFPTRRSSDLGFTVGSAGSHGNGRPGLLGFVLFLASHRILILASRSRELTDRKSTRLNSSHVSISYAVFCLKKKKYQALTSTRTLCCYAPTAH